MPEGDTLHRIARALGPALVGRAIDRLEVHDAGEIAELRGRQVTRVEARGKHLLVHIEGGWTLRTHLGMEGKVRKLHARERRPRASAVIVSGNDAFVVIHAYRAELVRTSALRTHPRLARLGPDLLDEQPGIDAAVRRASIPANAGREIADLLLDQRVAAGIGNVWKSEVLFERRIHPRTLVGALTADRLRELFETAARLMRANLGTRRRTSVPLSRRRQPNSDRLWVYGRAGKRCHECGTPIERFLQGDMARSTYLCPRCQALPGTR